MESEKPITSVFFRNRPKYIPTIDEEDHFIDCIKLSNRMAEAMLVLDFQKQNIQYVSNHALWLCGYSPAQIKSFGYNFFRNVLPKEDLHLWIEMHNIILKSLDSGEFSCDKINYFACTLRVRNHFLNSSTNYLMAYMKLIPIWINGKPRFGICLLSTSIVQKSGNLCVYFTNHDHSEYSFNTKKWDYHLFTPLSNKERELLVWAQQGLTQKEEADRMYVSVKSLEQMKHKLFTKLGVNSMVQALQYSTNQQLIYHFPFSKTENTQDKKTIPHLTLTPHPRKRLSISELQDVQQELNKSKSVLAVAKKKMIPESTVRGLIKQGKLTRLQKKSR